MTAPAALALAACLLGGSAPHPDHGSIAEAAIILDRGVVETALRVDARHLEDALSAAGERIDLERTPGVGLHIAAYLVERFELRPAGGEPLAIRWVGHELDGLDAWLYFEWRLPEAMLRWESESLEVRSRVMLERVERQQNTVTFSIEDDRCSLEFRRDDDGWKMLDLPALERALALRRDAAWTGSHAVVVDPATLDASAAPAALAEHRLVIVRCPRAGSGEAIDAVSPSVAVLARALQAAPPFDVLAIGAGPLAVARGFTSALHAPAAADGSMPPTLAYALAVRASLGDDAPARTVGFGPEPGLAVAGAGVLAFAEAIGPDLLDDRLRGDLRGTRVLRQHIVEVGVAIAGARGRSSRVHGTLETACVLRGAAAMGRGLDARRRPGPVTLAWIARDLAPDRRVLAIVPLAESPAAGD